MATRCNILQHTCPQHSRRSVATRPADLDAPATRQAASATRATLQHSSSSCASKDLAACPPVAGVQPCQSAAPVSRHLRSVYGVRKSSVLYCMVLCVYFHTLHTGVYILTPYTQVCSHSSRQRLHLGICAKEACHVCAQGWVGYQKITCLYCIVSYVHSHTLHT